MCPPTGGEHRTWPLRAAPVLIPTMFAFTRRIFAFLIAPESQRSRPTGRNSSGRTATALRRRPGWWIVSRPPDCRLSGNGTSAPAMACQACATACSLCIIVSAARKSWRQWTPRPACRSGGTAIQAFYQDPFGYNNGPRCSPLLTADKCYTLGAEGVLKCLDLKTGRQLWIRVTQNDFDLPQAFFGVGSSPVLEDGETHRPSR